MLAQIRAFMCRSASSQDPAAGEPRGPGGRRRIRAESPRQRCTRGGAKCGLRCRRARPDRGQAFPNVVACRHLAVPEKPLGLVLGEVPVWSPHRLRLRSHRRRRHYPERSSRSWTGTTKVRTGTTICPAIAPRMTAASCPGRPGTTCLASLRQFSPKPRRGPPRPALSGKETGGTGPSRPSGRAGDGTRALRDAGSARLFLEPDSRRAAVHWLVAGAGVGACLPRAMVAVASRRLPARRRFSRDRGTCW